MGKKALCLIFAFLFSIEIFAAAVSDNDGSAFITKAEFDSLKNEFQAQIDAYNQTITSTIDKAISSYLAGIKADPMPVDYFDTYVRGNGGSPIFYWYLPGVGVKTHQAKVDAFFDKELAYNVFSTIFYSGYFWFQDYGGGNTNACIDGGLVFNTEPNWAGPATNWTNLWMSAATRPKTKIDSNANRFVNFPITTQWVRWSTSTARPTTVRTKTVANNTSLTPSDQPVWTVLTDNGKNSLYLYQTNSCPYLVVNVHRHVYKNYGTLTTSFYQTDGGKTDYDTARTTITANTTTNYGEVTEGTNYTGTSTNIGNYIRQNLQKLETNDGVDYRMAVFPVANNNIYYLPTIPTVYLPTSDTTQSIANINWYDMYYRTMLGGQLQTNVLYGADLKYKRPYFDASQANITTFEIPSITSLIGSAVYHGDGFPLLKSLADDTNIKLTIKMKNSLNNTDDVTCLFSNKRLIRNAFDTSANITMTETFACNTATDITIRDIKKNDVIWINPISGTGDFVYIDTVTVSKISG